MLLIYAIMKSDSAKTLLTTSKDINFDVRAWANEKAEYLKVLGIKEIIYEVL